MPQFIRTDSSNQEFIDLVKKLDRELAERDGEENAFYAQFNKIDTLKHCIVAQVNNQAIGCGAIKPFHEGPSVEVKRMYVLPEFRGKGIAGKLLEALENWAVEMGYSKSVLETGKRQSEAIVLYHKQGYHITENYGQYQGIENSICFEKFIGDKRLTS